MYEPVFTWGYIIPLKTIFRYTIVLSPNMTAYIEATENVKYRNSTVKKKKSTEVYQTPSISRE